MTLYIAISVTASPMCEQDCDKRAQDYQRNSKTMREQYEASCRQLGLQGVRLKTEIVKLLDELPLVRGLWVFVWPTGWLAGWLAD